MCYRKVKRIINLLELRSSCLNYFGTQSCLINQIFVYSINKIACIIGQVTLLVLTISRPNSSECKSSSTARFLATLGSEDLHSGFENILVLDNSHIVVIESYDRNKTPLDPTIGGRKLWMSLYFRPTSLVKALAFQRMVEENLERPPKFLTRLLVLGNRIFR